MKKVIHTGIFFLSMVLSLTAQENWKPLFNGEDLDDWVILNGEADYLIEGDEIVGVSKMNTPNSFLSTKKNYGDFILEFEVKVDPSLNSGVQIRSNSIPSYRNDVFMVIRWRSIRAGAPGAEEYMMKRGEDGSIP